MRLTQIQIAKACRAAVPNPEHGPGQYFVVIDHLIYEEQTDLCGMPLNEAVETVLTFMNIGA